MLLAVRPLSARVVQVDVDDRREVLDGKSFGRTGSYEVLVGTVHFAIDPEHPTNQIITDVDKAPRNAQGSVEFSSDFYMVKPQDISRGNGAVLFEICNRGGKAMLPFLNFADRSRDPRSEAEYGDGYLLREGYVLLWLGWQFDVPQQEGLMRLMTQTAHDTDGPIEGLVRSDFVVREPVPHHSLADRNHIAYPAADPTSAENVMTVREARETPRRTIDRDQWTFARVEDGELIPDATQVHLRGAFQPGRIYEVVYAAQDPPLVGLGPAAVRDMTSYLKHGVADDLSIAAGDIDRAHGFGISQSGRFLRTFLYYGFNEDEEHRRVFDGIFAHVAGGGRGSFNHRFAQPSRDAHPFMNFLYPTDIFPFTGREQVDQETGLRDGLLTHRLKPQHWPKIFYTNSAYEYWGRAASLIHTTVDGTKDVPPVDNVRIYMFAGTQHGPGRFPPQRTSGQQLSNPTDYRWLLRRLLRTMDDWVADDVSPPDSRYPRLDEGTLVPLDSLGFPPLPGVGRPTRMHAAYRADYGPTFYSHGVVTYQPPRIGAAFPTLVPAVDADGNERSGVRLPGHSVPLATYTGWNLFNREYGPQGELASMVGSYIPFPTTETTRADAQDPRRSIKARYGNREDYVELVRNAALELTSDGFLLDEDLDAVVADAERHWDHLMVGAPPKPGRPSTDEH
jgi:hypothetical protein